MIKSSVQGIARNITRNVVLVMKSTVPVGTCAEIEKLALYAGDRQAIVDRLMRLP